MIIISICIYIFKTELKIELEGTIASESSKLRSEFQDSDETINDSIVSKIASNQEIFSKQMH